MNGDKLPNLYQFFSGYFHEDWKLENNYPDAVIHRYLNEVPHSIILQAIDEIEQLLDRNLSAEQLSDILIYDLGCCYDPQFQEMSDFEWLRWVQTSLRKEIEGVVALSA